MICVYTVGSSGGETKHSFGGVGFFGFNKQSSGNDINQDLVENEAREQRAGEKVQLEIRPQLNKNHFNTCRVLGKRGYNSWRGCALSVAMPQALRLRSVTGGKGERKTFNPNPVTFSQNPIPS